MIPPHEDTPDWDERHDGYSVDTGRTVKISGGNRGEVLHISSASAGLKVSSFDQGASMPFLDVVFIHGAPHTLEILEALYGVVLESLTRERKLQSG